MTPSDGVSHSPQKTASNTVRDIGHILRTDHRLAAPFLVALVLLASSQSTVDQHQGQLLAAATRVAPTLFPHRFVLTPRGPLIVAGVLALCLSAVGALVVGIVATVRRTDAIVRGRSVSLATAVRTAGRTSPRAIGYLLLAAAAVGAGLLAYVLPGIYLAVRLFVGVPAIVLDGHSPIGAVRESWRRTGGLEWQIVIVLALLVGAGFALSLVPRFGKVLAVTVVALLGSVASVVAYDAGAPSDRLERR